MQMSTKRAHAGAKECKSHRALLLEIANDQV